MGKKMQCYHFSSFLYFAGVLCGGVEKVNVKGTGRKAKKKQIELFFLEKSFHCIFES